MNKTVTAIDTRVGRIHVSQCNHKSILTPENVIVLSTGVSVSCTHCYYEMQDGKDGVMVVALGRRAHE